MFVHELVSQQAHVRPDAPALRYRGGMLTYRQLDAWADSFCP